MKKLTRIGVWSAAKVKAWMAGVVGLVVGVIMAIIWAVYGIIAIVGGATVGGLWILLKALGWLVLTPIAAWIAGLICGAICAFIFNLVAKRAGGLQLDL
jgi:hypothetical protein